MAFLGLKLRDSHYNFSSRMLHRLALSSDMLGNAAFDVEKALFSNKCAADEGKHVFVAGLARAGTTLLMRLLYESGEFCSLTYQDMPFVMGPNFWSKLTRYSQQTTQTHERAHGDGVLVSSDSPEALEEVFWRIHCGKHYIRAQQLIPMEADEDVLEEFRNYIQLILLRYSSSRYLSKNNNNLLRLPSIHRAFPEALILIPFRNPMTHAASLQRQHQIFCSMQSENLFIKQYMDWLVHHEFGLNHKPFQWPKTDNQYRLGGFNYWLQLWCDCYGYLVDYVQANPSVSMLVSYESLCKEPEKILNSLASKTKINNSFLENLDIKSIPIYAENKNAKRHLIAKAEKIYAQLQTLFVRAVK